MTILILLTTHAPNPLADELILAGYEVFEALAISEVLHLAEYHDVSAIIITAEYIAAEYYDLFALNEISQHKFIIKLGPNATSKEVIWELSNLFGRAGTVQ